jgi:hypothetical protein
LLEWGAGYGGKGKGSMRSLERHCRSSRFTVNVDVCCRTDGE